MRDANLPGLTWKSLWLVAAVLVMSFAISMTASADASPAEEPRQSPARGGDETMRKARTAIQERDYAQLEKVLRDSPSIINKPFDDEFTLLGFAAFRGDSDAVRILLEKGADPNVGERVLSIVLDTLWEWDLLAYSKSDSEEIKRSTISQIIRSLIEASASYSYMVDELSFFEVFVKSICEVEHYRAEDIRPFLDDGFMFYLQGSDIKNIEIMKYFVEHGFSDQTCVQALFERVRPSREDVK